MRFQRLGQTILAGVILLAALGLACLLLAGYFHGLEADTARTRHQAVRLLDQLTVVGDQLTGAARGYAATGDRRYYDAFVREVTVARTRDRVAQGLRQLGLTAEELALLRRAGDNAAALLALENRALEAATRRDLATAVAFVHGPAYLQAQAAVAQPITECQAAVDRRLSQTEATRGRWAKFFSGLALIAFLLLAGAVVVVLRFYYHRRMAVLLAASARRDRDSLSAEEGAKIEAQRAAGEIHDLTRELEKTRRSMETVEQQRWVSAQLAGIAGMAPKEETLAEFAQRLLARVLPLVQAGSGAFYRYDESRQRFVLVAGHGGAARSEAQASFAVGEGIIGQAALKKSPLLVTRIPPGYPKIPSQQGEASARMILAAPVLGCDGVRAVIEVASAAAWTDPQQALLNDLGTVVAPHLEALEQQAQVRALIEENRRLTTDLQTQRERLADAEARAAHALQASLAQASSSPAADAPVVTAPATAVAVEPPALEPPEIEETPVQSKKAQRRRGSRVEGQLSLFGGGSESEAQTVRDEAPAQVPDPAGEISPPDVVGPPPEVGRTEPQPLPPALEPQNSLDEPKTPGGEADLPSSDLKVATVADVPQVEPPTPAEAVSAPVPEPSPEPALSPPEPPVAKSTELRESPRQRKARTPGADHDQPQRGGPPSDLPGAEGLDRADGLRRADGDRKAYLQRLRQFVEEQRGAAEQIRDSLVRGQGHAAAQRARGLQNAAEGIGATAVQEAAGQIERALANNVDPGEIESLWGTLEKALGALVADLKSALKPPASRPLGPPPPLDPAEARPIVNLMLPLLADGDPGAADCLKANRSVLRSVFSSAVFPEFERRIRTGEFAEALDLLRKAGKRHGLLR